MAQADYYLKLDGIDGESVAKGHEKWIEIQSWSWGESNIGSQSSGAGAGKVSIQDFHFTSSVNKASPQLFQACASGKHFDKAILFIRKAGGGPSAGEFLYIKLYLQDILISSYQMGGDETAASHRAVDSFSLSFQKMEYLYTVQNTGEAVDAFIDFGQLGTP